MKRVSPGTVTVGVFAVVLGLVAVYAVRRAMDQPPAEQGVPIVVPRVNVTRHARLKQSDLTVIRVPRERVPQGAILVPAVAADRQTREALTAGRPILEGSLYPIGEGPTLAEMLPPGHQATTILVNTAGTPGSHIVTNSLIDVALTVEGNHPELGGEGGVGTLTLMRGLRVLANGGVRSSAGKNQYSLTVAATPEQVNKLILAERYGALSVTLRSALDDVVTNDTSENLVNTRTLLGLGPMPRKHQATIWRGGQQQVVTFESDLISESIDATAADDRRRNLPTNPFLPAGVKKPTEADNVLPDQARN